MKRNSFKSLFVASLLIALPLMADNDSLLGVELGYAGIDTQRSATPQITTKTYTLPNGGLKIGAEGDDYRLFLDLHYYANSDRFDYLTTYGTEFDYMLHLSESANLYLGVGIGMANIKFTPTKHNATDLVRTLSDYYYSGTLGFNFEITNGFDLDLGARYTSINSNNTKNSVEYNFDNLINGYATFIYKFTID